MAILNPELQPASNHSTDGNSDWTNGSLPIYKGAESQRVAAKHVRTAELRRASKAQDLIDNPNSTPESRDRACGAHVYGVTVEQATELVESDVKVCEARIREIERQMIDPAPLELSPNSTEHDHCFVASKDFVLQSATGRERDLAQGDLVTSEEAKSHARAASNVAGALELAKGKLKEAELIQLHRPDVVSERIQTLELEVQGYCIEYPCNMSSTALQEFKKEIKERLPTRARRIRNPETNEDVWVMPAESMVITPSMKHLELPEPIESLWKYRR